MFTTEYIISSSRVKNKPTHPLPSLSLREQCGLEVGEFSAILVKFWSMLSLFNTHS